ncbi:hypothetical protein [Liquorilactobacillus hordei]|uniref:hypothetical protein n=1 Tax=Liquorilactobacillus hordei TaxID=468911 RepID=UPI001CBA91A2|nr:hypothetical protein [Liquorilactobacillus hordei]MBZ2406655.1 hypothetical protein [Liquorilactobacillus hordei]
MANNILQMEKLIKLGLDYKIEGLEIAGTVRSTGEVPFLRIDFLKEEFSYQQPTVLIDEQLKKIKGQDEHEYQIISDVSREKIKKLIKLLREKGFKENTQI